jgi:hypothetical protein
MGLNWCTLAIHRKWSQKLCLVWKDHRKATEVGGGRLFAEHMAAMFVIVTEKGEEAGKKDAD